MTASYCVVGGGISGLAAAHRLRATLGGAVDITVFEPAERLGGVLRTESLGGIPMDVGAEAFIARRPEVPALLAELGLADRQRSTTGVRPLLYSRRLLHRLPPGTLSGIPASPESMTGLVDDETLTRIAAEPGRPLEFEPGSDPALGALVADRFGEQVVAHSVDPLIGGVYAGSAATVGLRSAVPGLATALDAGAPNLTEAVRRALPATSSAPVFGAIDGGYQVLIDALARSSGLRWIQSAVTQIDPVGDGWQLRDSAGGVHRADRVVMAVPAHVLARVATGFAPVAAAAASRIDHASSVVVAMAVPAGAALPDNSGVLVATGERLHAKAMTLTSRKWGSWGHGGKVELLRLSFGRFGDSRIRASDGQLVTWSVQDIEAVFGVVVDPVEVRVQRWPAAMPQYRSGHAALATTLRAGLPPTVAVAGNFLDGIGVPACIAAADRAVAAVISATPAP
ncbi:protoporphyrinogen oxidase [Mycolicibacter sp. MYC123]|uniref:Coproporphyrinogen III oxidase n=1 Tax=[Mycobacterium] zoologicum TaxID=2872311 RepID=A0ABU5YMK8_9MYCO|nr:MULTISPECIES: protoporphyrinogen oxidase [unclassified Mycolicibacter]MEB3051302.1 protoporphyrinogen oxidase [Mycolicibacter sp. MYC123]MEB3064866.1 protoporphyrinogen oxidase [Mycolicibacter sp. MYC101]